MEPLSALVSILFFGISFGMVLYLISVGLSVTMGLMRFVNLAHGVFAMAGGYATVLLMGQVGVPFGFALVGAFVVSATLGLVLERVLYARFYGASDFDQVLLSIALIYIAIGFARHFWGAAPQPMHIPALLTGGWRLFGHIFPLYRLFLIGFSAALIVILWLVLDRSRFGAQVRAGVDNPRMTRSLGINIYRLFSITFALGSGLAGLGGGLGAEILAISPQYPLQHAVYFIMVVLVGGMGTVRGPFAGALVLGVGDTACRYLFPQAGGVFVYLLVFAILLWRPAGLFPLARS
jgi:branched-chain amino acid transport system permease protein